MPLKYHGMKNRGIENRVSHLAEFEKWQFLAPVICIKLKFKVKFIFIFYYNYYSLSYAFTWSGL
ncbi:hypothetical protein GCM10007094_03090 [Pseudovibrio japonicus]|uniref:Uncharacterized protein n=1 Tax=Pseudovibrio japonicus TaxID=366534 RepID=A0ABQ3DWT6_9HYPH|nr:hypothetical protein GCM10007094_03090 [Pseudovibrio japonicus]